MVSDVAALGRAIGPLNELMKGDERLRVEVARTIAALAYRWVMDNSSVPVLLKFEKECGPVGEATLVLFRLRYLGGEDTNMLYNERTVWALDYASRSTWLED